MYLFCVLFGSFILWGYIETLPHIHWWSPVQRRYEMALGCRCGILSFIHKQDEVVIVVCKTLNRNMLKRLLRLEKPCQN